VLTLIAAILLWWAFSPPRRYDRAIETLASNVLDIAAIFGALVILTGSIK